MGEHNRTSSIVLIIVAILVSIGSIRIGLGTFSSPGSGFVPFIAAVFLGLFSLPTLIRTLIVKRLKEAGLHEAINLRRGIKTIVSVLIYLLLLPSIGYVIGTFFLMLFLFKGVGSLRWRWALIAAVVTVIASYLVFDLWLQCPFPVGLINIKGLMR